MQDVTLTLPMIQDMELTASRTASAMGEHIRMSRDKIDEVQMAVVEATINAFEHSRAVDGKVSIHFQVLGTEEDPTGLQITVKDAGIGIANDKLPKLGNGGQPAKLQQRGHGLRIIYGLMDEVDVRSDDHGTTVVMMKLR
jgi:anti-sigma regulatory factor (Ser/Thr protein kinase)